MQPEDRPPWGALRDSGHCRAWRQSPILGEVVLATALSLQAARAFSGQASFGRAEQVDLTERASMPAEVFRTNGSKCMLAGPGPGRLL